MPQVWNYQVAFLVGKKMADTNKPTHEDLETVLRVFESNDFNFGTTDMYSQFLAKFSKKTKIKLNDRIIQLKKAPSHEKAKILKELTEETKQYILKTNELDYRLFIHAKRYS